MKIISKISLMKYLKNKVNKEAEEKTKLLLKDEEIKRITPIMQQEIANFFQLPKEVLFPKGNFVEAQHQAVIKQDSSAISSFKVLVQGHIVNDSNMEDQ